MQIKPEAVRSRILHRLKVLHLPEETVAGTFISRSLQGCWVRRWRSPACGKVPADLHDWQGSAAQLRGPGGLQGSREAAIAAVNKAPSLLTRSWGLAYLQQRARYWQLQLGGATAAPVLLECGTALKTKLSTMGPRVAWTRLQGGQAVPGYLIWSDDSCMLRHGVSLQGFDASSSSGWHRQRGWRGAGLRGYRVAGARAGGAAALLGRRDHCWFGLPCPP